MVSLPPTAELTDLSKGGLAVPTGAVQKTYRCSECRETVKKLVLAKPCVESYCAQCQDDTVWVQETDLPACPKVQLLRQEYRCNGCDVPKKLASSKPTEEGHCPVCGVVTTWGMSGGGSPPPPPPHVPPPPPPHNEYRTYHCTACHLGKTFPLTEVYVTSHCPSCGHDTEWAQPGANPDGDGIDYRCQRCLVEVKPMLDGVPCAEAYCVRCDDHTEWAEDGVAEGSPEETPHERKKYRCQGCNKAVKELLLSKVHIESYCVECLDDTEWILLDVQDDDSAMGSDTSTVKLVVEGQPFYAASHTFLDQPEESLFSVLCSNRYDVMDDGAIQVDRPSKWFQNILDFCRQGALVGNYTFDDLTEIEEEARFYCLTQLVEHVMELKSGGDVAPVVKDCNSDVREITCLQNEVRSRMTELNSILSKVSKCGRGEPTRLLHESCTDLMQVTTTVLTEVIATLHHSLPAPGSSSEADWVPSIASAASTAPSAAVSPPVVLTTESTMIVIPRQTAPSYESLGLKGYMCGTAVFCGLCSAGSLYLACRRKAF